ncbi:DUF3302 domain-containing protein [Roseibium sp.]|uniref:DUF3302 domain-containing protein n=1 Tax=Roseibium sp. TaxID=1936156 RepID=UPI003BAC3697
MNWDYFTFGIMGVILLLIVFLIFFFGDAPGKIARERGHPQADAINVCAWIGLAAGGVGWVVALVWAYTRPVGITVTPKLEPANAETMGSQELKAEITNLKGRLAELEHHLEAQTGQKAKQGDAS